MWKQVGKLLIPKRFPEKIGLGCPKCDDSIIIPFESRVVSESNPQISAFIKKHEACTTLETLEVHGGRLEVTGQLKEKGS